jgi:hypothetical protein
MYRIFAQYSRWTNKIENAFINRLLSKVVSLSLLLLYAMMMMYNEHYALMENIQIPSPFKDII